MPLDSTGFFEPFVLPADAGPWWKGHEGELAEALRVADAAAPHLSHLARFLLPRLPRRVLASSTIKGEGERPSSRVLPLAQALRHQWISLNGPGYVNTETADVDVPVEWRSALFELVRCYDAPLPVAVISSPWKGTPHILWAYGAPFANGSEAQRRLRRGIKRGLTLLGACPRFGNRLQKNPWHLATGVIGPQEGIPCGDPEIWNQYCAERSGLTYHTQVMNLETTRGRDLFASLAAYATDRKVTLLERKIQSGPLRHIPLGLPDTPEGKKGSRLFHAAARATRRACTGDATRIHGIVARTAAAMGSPASAADITSIAQSITDWMNSQWWGPLDGKAGSREGVGRKVVDAGAMTREAVDRGLDSLKTWRALPVAEKRRAAAERTNTGQVRRNSDAVREAVTSLLAAGAKVTRTAVAERAGVSVSTVKRRWKTLELGPEETAENGSNGLIRPCGPTPSSLSVCSPPPSPVPPGRVIADVARADREARRARTLIERNIIRRYHAQAARLRRRGARDEVIPAVRPGSSPTLRAAHADALDAQRHLRRRIEMRRSRARTEEAAAEREAWHAEHRGDEEGWKARLKTLGARREEALENLSERPQAAERVDLMFAAIFGAEHRARRKARREPEVFRSARQLACRGLGCHEMFDVGRAEPASPQKPHSLDHPLVSAVLSELL